MILQHHSWLGAIGAVPSRSCARRRSRRGAVAPVRLSGLREVRAESLRVALGQRLPTMAQRECPLR